MDKRDIQVHCGALQLADYKWSLKNWEGQLLATQHFMVSSQGKSGKLHPDKMGKYSLVRNIVMPKYCPVYKHDDKEFYLYKLEGYWCISDIAGDDEYSFFQPSDNSPSPVKTVPWHYFARDEAEFREDVTLKIYPCY